MVILVHGCKEKLITLPMFSQQEINPSNESLMRSIHVLYKARPLDLNIV